MNKFFVEGRHEVGDVVAFDGGDAHKIISVLRKRDGDPVEVIDSAARRFLAEVRIDGRSAGALLTQLREQAQSDIPHVTLAQGVPKGQKMDFVVEKLTELGVASIVPLQSERTVVSDVSPNKLERWRRLAKSAAQQCGRADIPQITDPRSLTEVLAGAGGYDVVLFPWELAQAEPLRDCLPALLADARRILVIVGPEGGFSHAEAQAAQAAGAHAISLGKRILRTETAGLVALAVIAYVTGCGYNAAMLRLLENLQPGTAVCAANGESVGEVRAVYGSGESRGAQFLLVFWSARGEAALINADEVSTITEAGVVLRSSGSTYADLPAFDPSVNPLLHRL